jgi:hypothetical protein
MRISLGHVRRMISEALDEVSSAPTGMLRQVRGSGRQQFKIGKVEDINSELSTGQVNSQFPGAADAWAEVVPDMYRLPVRG